MTLADKLLDRQPWICGQSIFKCRASQIAKLIFISSVMSITRGTLRDRN